MAYPEPVPHNARPGWNRSFSRFGGVGNESCRQCSHGLDRHFWWTKPGHDDEIGCRDCREYTCQNQREVRKVSAVNLCERCGALMLGKAVGSIDLLTGESARNEHIEMCPGCIGDLKAFLETAPTREHKAPYREEWKPAPKQSESRLMLEHGYCGDSYREGEGLCLRAKGHEGEHRDGELLWS